MKGWRAHRLWIEAVIVFTLLLGSNSILRDGHSCGRPMPPSERLQILATGLIGIFFAVCIVRDEASR